MTEKELLGKAQTKLGGRLTTYDGALALHLAERNEHGQVVDTYLSPSEAGFRAGLNVVAFTEDLDEAISISKHEGEEMILSELATATGLQHDQLRRAAGDGRLQARQLYKSGPWLSTIADVEAALEGGTLQRRVGRPQKR